LKTCRTKEIARKYKKIRGVYTFIYSRAAALKMQVLK